MKKILACCIGLIGLTFCVSHTYKIEITFTVDVEPKTDEDFELIKAPFEGFAELAQSLENGPKALRQLTRSLEANLAKVPKICQKQNMKGNVTCDIRLVD